MKTVGKIQLIGTAVAGLMLFAGPTWASPVDGFGISPETSLQDLLDSYADDGSSVDVTTDDLSDGADSYWSTTASGISGATLIIELAGNDDSNEFGIFDRANPTNSVKVFTGGESSGDKVAITFDGSGNVIIDHIGSTISDETATFAGDAFGFYLHNETKSIGPFYSDTALNADGGDHMVAYAGNNEDHTFPGSSSGTWTENEYVLAWEDLPKPDWDRDYNDFVVMVESIEPIPLPATAWLMGAALLMLVGIGRRARRTALSGI